MMNRTLRNTNNLDVNLTQLMLQELVEVIQLKLTGQVLEQTLVAETTILECSPEQEIIDAKWMKKMTYTVDSLDN